MEQIELNNHMTIPAIIFGPDEIGYTPYPKALKNAIPRGTCLMKRITIDKYIYTAEVANALRLGFHFIDLIRASNMARDVGKEVEHDVIKFR